MTDSSNHDDGNAQGDRPGGISWRTMLLILALALIVAVVVAYLLVDPFFHQHSP